MESYSLETERSKEEIAPKSRRGGLITMPFIIANESFEKVASYGILPNMIFYLMKDYGMSVMKATNLLFLWSAATYFTPTVGAFLADSYLGRFRTIAFGSVFSLLGLILLWLTAMIPNLRPPPCNPLAPPCKSATSSQFGFLVSAFSLMSVGAGGIRSSSIAYGADQLDRRDDPNSKKAFETFFSWYYVSACVSVLIALTGIVYIQDHKGWKLGFAVPAILMFLSASLFLVASPFYIKRPVSSSIFTGFAQVVVVAIKNRRLDLPPLNSGRYHSHSGSEYKVPTDRLRFLNKACIIRNPEDVTTDGVAANPWTLCTAEQVEQLKILIRIIPIWSASIMISIFTSQSFPLLQASAMDRHLTSNFQIPAGSFSVFLMISLTLWVFVYDRIFIPLASKLRGKPVSISPKIRIGLGLLVSIIAVVIAGAVEHIRRNKAIKNPVAALGMSAMWLVPQYCLYGIAEALNSIAQIEFYYMEFPKSMSSIGASMYQLGIAVGNLVASLILNLVDKYTEGEGKESWIGNDVNKAHYDYYYWFLAILSFINLLYYMLCCWAYGPSVNEISKDSVEDNLKSGQNSFRYEKTTGESSFILGATARVCPDALDG